MKAAIIGIIIKTAMYFISPETVARVLAACVAWLLRYASRHGGKAWDVSKKILKNGESWIHLFNEVYEDDKLTPEEETHIAEEIKNLTSKQKIRLILDKAKTGKSDS